MQDALKVKITKLGDDKWELVVVRQEFRGDEFHYPEGCVCCSEYSGPYGLRLVSCNFPEWRAADKMFVRGDTRGRDEQGITISGEKHIEIIHDTIKDYNRLNRWRLAANTSEEQDPTLVGWEANAKKRRDAQLRDMFG